MKINLLNIFTFITAITFVFSLDININIKNSNTNNLRSNVLQYKFTYK